MSKRLDKRRPVYKLAAIAALMLLAVIPVFARKPAVPDSGKVYTDISMKAAQTYCDSVALRGPEGIYVWPERNAVVLVRTSRNIKSAPTEYEIVNIESADIMCQPGAVLGFLFASGTTSDLHAFLYPDTDLDKSVKAQHVAAKYDVSDRSIRFIGKSWKFTYNPLALFPTVRSIFRIYRENPMKQIHDGLLRIYPQTGADASIIFPRYL